MAICRYCRNRPASVEAHILPRSFIREQSVKGKPNFLISNRTTFSPKTWTGVYDDSLVCDECEGGFSPYDDYGYRFYHSEPLTPIYDQGTLVAWQSLKGDAAKLHILRNGHCQEPERRCELTYSFSASSIRVCQPRPVARK